MIDLAKLRQSLRLDASLETLRELHDEIYPILERHDPAEQQALLLIMERLVLDKLGHICTIEFGKNAVSGKRCSVCHVPLEQAGQGVSLISRWETTSVFLGLCDTHAAETFQVDIDLLTGKLTSEIVEA